jgi:hypothetical protein
MRSLQNGLAGWRGRFCVKSFAVSHPAWYLAALSSKFVVADTAWYLYK